MGSTDRPSRVSVRRNTRGGNSGRLPSHYRRLCALRSVESAIEFECKRKPGVETGGVLVGFIDESKDAVVVVSASGPGPRALHRSHRFNRDAVFCQAWLDEWVRESDGRLDFVGEWHSHPETHPTPSSVDVGTFTRLAANPACHLDRLALLIAGTRAGGRWRARDQLTRVNGWSVRADGVAERVVEWLPDEAYTEFLGPPATREVP